jgi:hypothetical protein
MVIVLIGMCAVIVDGKVATTLSRGEGTQVRYIGSAHLLKW